MNKFGQVVNNFSSQNRFNQTEINIADIDGVSFQGDTITFNGVGYVSLEKFNELMNRVMVNENINKSVYENTREKVVYNYQTFYLIPRNLTINLNNNIVSLKEEGKAYYRKNGDNYDVYIDIDINDQLQYIKGYLVEHNRPVLLRFLNNPLDITANVDINNNYDFINFI